MLQDEEGAKRVTELTAVGVTAEYYGFDVTNEEQVTSNINTIGNKYGKIDLKDYITSFIKGENYENKKLVKIN